MLYWCKIDYMKTQIIKNSQTRHKQTNPMDLAIMHGYLAAKKGEVPIGAVIVKNGKIIAKAYNNREKSNIATHHAEILAIERANKKLRSWRLDDCELYVTLEPCPMCAGAMLNARIKKLYYACTDLDSGAVSKFNMLSSTLNHTTESEQLTDYQNEVKEMIQNFFKEKRKISKK